MYRFPISRVANPELTTAQLAERTGLSAGTLRMWENRHGFPDPSRLPGGHRRYAEADVEHVREVLRLRDQGLSLPAAIERVRTRRPAVAVSVFAGLRRRRPEVAPTVLPKPAVLALSRAIEDEYCARAADGVLIGSFQRERFYRQAQRRWRELARTADLAVALADFATPRRSRGRARGGAGRPPPCPRAGVGGDSSAPRASRRAWPRGSSRPRPRCPTPQRRFEVLWSFEPSVVADAVAVAAELLCRAIDARLAARLRVGAAGRSARTWTRRPPCATAGRWRTGWSATWGRLVAPGQATRDVRT